MATINNVTKFHQFYNHYVRWKNFSNQKESPFMHIYAKKMMEYLFESSNVCDCVQLRFFSVRTLLILAFVHPSLLYRAHVQIGVCTIFDASWVDHLLSHQRFSCNNQKSLYSAFLCSPNRRTLLIHAFSKSLRQ